MSENDAAVVAQEKICRQMYAHFKSEKIQGEKSIWGSMKNRKLLTFKLSCVNVNQKFREKLES